MSSGLDNSLTAVGLDRPNVVPGVDPYVKNMNTRQWLTPSAFTPNLPGQYGNLGQASLVGPGYFEIDAALSRNFTIPRHEAQRLEVRFETFNVLNHTNFNTPTTSLTSSTFGTILSARDPRILQFAMKYVF